MTGITHGLSNIVNLSKGNTPILKVSLGDTLVYPSGGSLAELRYIQHQPFTTSYFVVPTSWAVGDLAVLFEASAGTTVPVNTVPTGWTQAVTIGQNNQRLSISYKVLTAGDLTGNNVYGISGTQNNSKVLVRYRGRTDTNAVTQVTSASFSQAQASSSNGFPPDQYHDVAILNAKSVLVAGYRSSQTASLAPRMTQGGVEVSEGITGAGSSFGLMNVRYDILSGGTQITVGMNDPGSANAMASVIITAA